MTTPPSFTLPPLVEIAAKLGGDVAGAEVLAPGPGHSAADRSLSIKPDANAPDGFLVHSFSGDDDGACKQYVREKLGLESKANGKAHSGAWTLLSEHVYLSKTGEPYLRVRKCRDGGGKKQFPQSHWDGDRWVKGR